MAHITPFFFAACLFFSQKCQSQNKDVNTITKNQMSVDWEVQGEYLKIRMEAPTSGWVAVGFNTKAGLSGTSLLMGRIRENTAEVVDYFVQAPGQYNPVTELGGYSAISQVSGTEDGQYSQITFSVALDPGGAFHHQLVPDKTYHLLLAYSRDDDFAHHSMMRTSIEIKL